MTYHTWCVFEDRYTNPLTGRCGRWRVLRSYQTRSRIRVMSVDDELMVQTSKQHQPGSIISPTKAPASSVRIRG